MADQIVVVKLKRRKGPHRPPRYSHKWVIILIKVCTSTFLTKTKRGEYLRPGKRRKGKTRKGKERK